MPISDTKIRHNQDPKVSNYASLGLPHSGKIQSSKKLLDKAGVILWQADPNRRVFSYIGPHAEGLFGFPLAKWTEPGFWERRLHPDDRTRVTRRTENQSGDDTIYEIEYRLIGSNGQIVPLRDTVVTVGRPGHDQCLQGVMVNRTAEEENEQQLHALSGQLISSQESERRRIACDLHDDTSQRLAVLAVRLELFQQDFAESERALAKLMELSAEIQAISSDIHALCYQLHPSKLEQLGLVRSLKRLCLELTEQRHCLISFTARRVPKHMSDETSLCLYRVAQESIHNALKHSGGSRIQVELIRDDDAVRLSISDNGHGFRQDPNALQHGIGLTSMRERLRYVHGLLAIENSVRGVRIQATVQFQKAKKTVSPYRPCRSE